MAITNGSTASTAPTSNKNVHVAIIGSGIAGITLAIALHKRRVDFCLYDQSTNFAEIGAGVSFTPNAVGAMKICDPKIKEGFDKVSTGNLTKAKENVYFDWVDGYTKTPDDKEPFLYSIDRSGSPDLLPSSNGCHRADFLDEMVKLVPKENAEFGMRLFGIDEVKPQEREDGRALRLNFQDGSIRWADCVVGCDGIKSKVRQMILGEDSPASYPHYTHKFAYRGLIPMEKAIEELGEDMAGNRHMHSGPEAHVLTFPVANGKLMNVVAFVVDPKDWPDHHRLTAPAKKAEAIEAFKDWGPTVRKIMDMLLDDLDRWAIFDTLDHPPSTYHKGLLCISGDAAHATSPHHGSGAGMCIEDSAVLADLLLEAKHIHEGDQAIETPTLLNKTFAVFSDSRIERTKFLVSSSRKTGNVFEWMDPDCGKDPVKSKEEMLWRHHKIWHADLPGMIESAKQDLRQQLQV